METYIIFLGTQHYQNKNTKYEEFLEHFSSVLKFVCVSFIYLAGGWWLIYEVLIAILLGCGIKQYLSIQ